MHGGSFFVRLGENLHFVGHHKGGIETKAKVSNQVLLHVFVFVKEVGCTAESNLVDVFFNLFSRHAYAAVLDGERLFFAVEDHLNSQVAQLALQFASRGDGFELLCGIYGVGDELT